jgi:hypothetical protein
MIWQYNLSDSEQAYKKLAEGPSDLDNTPRHYIVYMSTGFGPGYSDIIFDFPSARWEYFPDAGNPSHLLVWTPSSSHIFNYYELNCNYEFEL